jgi:uncharacterized protein
MTDWVRGRERMTQHKNIVETYIDGFRRTDHNAILSCLDDNIVWVLHGYKTLHGKEAFNAEIENDAAVGNPTLNIDRLIEEGNTVVAIGHGEMTLKESGPVSYVFTEIFTFTGDKINHLETFHINLGGPGDAIFTAPDA